MLIRQHSPPNALNRCSFCGGLASPEGLYGDELRCNQREADTTSGTLMPEPQRRQYAFDDMDIIGQRVAEIRLAEQPVCPLDPNRTLYVCLRTPTRCTESCPLRADWIGPQS